jgi:hypothetical protein
MSKTRTLQKGYPNFASTTLADNSVAIVAIAIRFRIIPAH